MQFQKKNSDWRSTSEWRDTCSATFTPRVWGTCSCWERCVQGVLIKKFYIFNSSNEFVSPQPISTDCLITSDRSTPHCSIKLSFHDLLRPLHTACVRVSTGNVPVIALQRRDAGMRIFWLHLVWMQHRLQSKEQKTLIFNFMFVNFPHTDLR